MRVLYEVQVISALPYSLNMNIPSPHFLQLVDQIGIDLVQALNIPPRSIDDLCDVPPPADLPAFRFNGLNPNL
jgi:hypothetical protein